MVSIITSSHFRDLAISNSDTCGNTLGVFLVSLTAFTTEARSRAASVSISFLKFWDDPTAVAITTLRLSSAAYVSQ
jgi:hypothetical protein